MGDYMALYTDLHTAIALAGIFSGFIVLYGLLNATRFDKWTAFFLGTTLLTSLTGFGFPFTGLLPSHIFGVLSLVLLALAIYARYLRHLAGKWRLVYVITAVFALYLNTFVAVVQSFLKIPALRAMAPTQTEAPFVISQALLLLIFVVVGFAASARFRIQPSGSRTAPLL
ncbi:MAG: hypothetical protein V4628_12795 [Pseudomonadota bacterium]